MLVQLRTASVMVVLFTLLTGLVYPWLVTGIAQLGWHEQANGSLIRDGETLRGSRLIGQEFSGPQYFWGRRSAVAYNAAGSSGSNAGPLNPSLVTASQERADRLRVFGGGEKIPVDLLTTSGSGLDPHISPAAAEYQIPRVLAHRPGLSEAGLRQIVAQHSTDRWLALFGEPVVNVLELNLALDREESVVP
jgi:K+-transporting ATPase ATPase C chain